MRCFCARRASEPPALERELRAHRSRQAEIGLRLVRASSLVFTTQHGKPQSRRNALRALHNAGEAAGLHGENLFSRSVCTICWALAGRERARLERDVRRSSRALARHANAKVTSADLRLA